MLLRDSCSNRDRGIDKLYFLKTNLTTNFQSDIELASLLQSLLVALEDLYKDATPKASQAMLFVLSDLTRAPNQLAIPYLIGRSSLWPTTGHPSSITIHSISLYVLCFDIDIRCIYCRYRTQLCLIFTIYSPVAWLPTASNIDVATQKQLLMTLANYLKEHHKFNVTALSFDAKLRGLVVAASKSSCTNTQ